MSTPPGTPAPNPVARLRNLGIVAHINAGKTTLSERILVLTGKQRFFGKVEEGTATMDWMREEQQRGISITAAVASVLWKGYALNLIDTPGHVDFTAEVQRSLRVLDGVIVVLDGVRGVESQTEIVWRQVAARRVPRVVFVNKMDREVADFARAVASVRERLRAHIVPIVVPVVRDHALVGLVDIVRRTTFERVPLDEVEVATALEPARATLIEALAESDDQVLAEYVAGRDVDTALLDRALRAACVQGDLVPVLAGAALPNFGVDWLLDAACRYLPSPLDVAPVVSLDDPAARRRPAVEEPFCGLCFKVQAATEAAPPLHFVRVYSGEIRAGARLLTTQGPLAIATLYRVHAGDREVLERAGPGDVFAFEANDKLVTGDTLYAEGHPMRLEPVSFPEPVLITSLEPERADDLAAVEGAARLLQREDPTLDVQRDPLTGALVVRGMGELHLEVFADRVQRVARAGVRVGRPAVARWETIQRTVAATAECRRSGPEGESSARVEVALVPRPHLGSAMVEDLAGPVAVGVPQAQRMALLEAMGQALRHGLQQPYPARDLVFQLIASQVEASEADGPLLLLEALRVAIRKAMASAQPGLLEPVVALAIETPNAALSAVLADLGSRGTLILSVESAFEVAQVRGLARLSALLGYATRLRSLTKGLGTVQLETRGLILAEEGTQTPTPPLEKELRSLDRRELPR